MRKLIVFNHATLDGYIADAKGEMNWAHRANRDAEWNEFVAGNASGDGQLLFGRVTYQLMASYWPTPMAMKNDPVVATAMNNMPKVVFSRTLNEASWANTKLVKGDLVEEVRKMKNEDGPGMAIMGSASIVSQLAQAGLIDEYQIALNPIVLGRGKTMFETVKQQLNLKLTRTRPFANGTVMLWYVPAL